MLFRSWSSFPFRGQQADNGQSITESRGQCYPGWGAQSMAFICACVGFVEGVSRREAAGFSVEETGGERNNPVVVTHQKTNFPAQGGAGGREGYIHLEKHSPLGRLRRDTRTSRERQQGLACPFSSCTCFVCTSKHVIIVKHAIIVLSCQTVVGTTTATLRRGRWKCRQRLPFMA